MGIDRFVRKMDVKRAFADDVAWINIIGRGQPIGSRSAVHTSDAPMRMHRRHLHFEIIKTTLKFLWNTGK